MDDYHALERRMKALSNARRLQILSYIKRKKTAMVGDIAHAIHLSMFATSHHLRILKAAQVVGYKKRGRQVYYRLSFRQIEPIKKVLSLL